MPIWDIECNVCKETFEFLKIKSDEEPICPKCQSKDVSKLFTSFQIRMNPDDILRSMPDVVPPLEELRGKGSEGYSDKPEASVKNMKRSKDKFGNTIWTDKEKMVFDLGRK